MGPKKCRNYKEKQIEFVCRPTYVFQKQEISRFMKNISLICYYQKRILTFVLNHLIHQSAGLLNVADYRDCTVLVFKGV